jgi:hypothetical protein
VTHGTIAFDAIVNVNDESNLTFKPYPVIQKVWLPLYEASVWPYATIHAILLTLHDLCAVRHKRVYLHCAAGSMRAPTIATLYLIAEGKTVDEAVALVGSDILWDSVKGGSLPPDIIAFATAALKTDASTVVLLNQIAPENIKRLQTERLNNAAHALKRT